MVNLPAFDSVRVLCVGDVMLDCFVEGTVERISPESPVPILRYKQSRKVPGGAANVARNVVTLGATCTLVSVLGDDPVAEELVTAIDAEGGIRLHAVRDHSRPTTEKTRFTAAGQHLLRVDREENTACSETVQAALLSAAAEHIGAHDVLVLSDYAKGVLSDAVTRALVLLAIEAGVPVIADPKTISLDRYRGATLITPNVHEALAATGIRATDDASAERALATIATQFGVNGVLLTRAEQGMSLRTQDGAILHIPATARDVFDVVGAGDTVVAVLALMLGADADAATAATIANTAGGIVVSKHGTATLTRSELMDELAHHIADRSSSAVKILDGMAAAARAAEWRAAGLTVGFTNGCFDILHAGHIQLLQFARSRCDRLIVGINDDASIRRLKGASRPINPLEDRSQVLAALAAVDAVVPFAEDTPFELIAALRPGLLVKGADYAIENIVGADLVLAAGGRVERFELLEGRSTTRIVEMAADTRARTPA
ncbi:D-glycero-beta-D-manno-heptose-7-phosphate kinase [Sphingomonas sp. HT-1]|uniref:D-glycero-beta-D-manno-heptose-7-phosphate kinase n=1 Tax=unclassified Sphingomonas TaxID=196159 RepID=UPI00037E09FF|nr:MULTISPECIES: D-glycero-beta-D-manno-heptose-7-phosphate kinase [unclassified Sphingomonas]KTF68921.1 bifunctional heptose 7-phosphate kinase/heptose 1-phosphate adenyltransferase [Sphingomonas sp. WG]